MNSKRFFVTGIAVLFAAILASCNSGSGENSAERSPTPSPPSPRAERTLETPGGAEVEDAAATPAIEVPGQITGGDRRVGEISGISLAECPVRTEGRRVAIGTVPIPTPTQTPADLRDSRQATRDYLVGAIPLVDTAVAMTEGFDREWNRGVDVRERAEVLVAETRRLAALCKAVAGWPDSGGPVDSAKAVSDALRGRRDALESELRLLVSGDFEGEGDVRSSSSDSIRALTAQLQGMSEVGGFEYAQLTIERRLSNGNIGLSVVVPTGWVTIRNDGQIILQAPPGMQEWSLNGLGPERWDLGVSFRIRSFAESLVAASNPGQFLASVTSGLGTGEQSGEITVAEDSAQLTVFVADRPPWRTYAATTVINGRRIVIELGCDSVQAEECRVLFDQLVRSIQSVPR